MTRVFLAAVLAVVLIGTPFRPRELFAQETPTVPPTETPVPTDTPVPTATPVPTDTPEPTATAEPTPTPAPEEEEAADEDDDLPWLLIVLGGIAGALLLLLLVVLLTRRGPDAGALWRSRATDAYGRAAATHDAISMELATTTPAADDARARQRWQEIERRLDDLAAELHALSTNPPTQELERAVNRLLAALHALRSAVSAEVPPEAPPQPPQQLAALIRQRLSELDAEIRRLRELF